MRIAIALVALLSVAAAVGLAGTASAAQPEREIIDLGCGDDGVLEVALVPGNGAWTPAKLTDGAGVFIPFAFSNAHGEFTDNEGNTETFSDPDAAKNGPHNKKVYECHFRVEFEDENGSGFFEGDVEGFIAGR